MSLFIKLIASAVISALLVLGGTYEGEHLKTQPASFGSFSPVQASQFTLAGAGITNSQTTIQLATFTLPDPNKTPITMSMFGSIGYGVLDPQTSKIENISFTGVTQNNNGSATLTGVTRGISFYSPFVGSTTLSLSHAGGSSFILSNSAAFYGQFAFPNNTQTWLATQTYGSTTPPTYDADPIWANYSTQVFADVSYVNSVVAAGAANASETVKGIIQLATGAQAALGTSIGSTGARLVVPNSLATSTPYSGTPQGSFPTSAATGGKISQLWLDLTQTFAFLNAITAPTSTIGTLNVGSIFATSSIKINGQNVLTSFSTPHYTLNSASVVTAITTGYATSSSVLSIPAGTLAASSTITVRANISCIGSSGAAGTCNYFLKDSGGNTLASCGTLNTATANQTFSGTLSMVITNQSSLSSQTGYADCSAFIVGNTISNAVNYSIAGGVVSSSFNTANALNLVLVVQQTVTNAQTTINSYSITVNP